ncbi:LuxR C-terminal-related transcriptional regulator [Streptomyces sp. MAR4 CNX-425]|uniref:LuxR C-terminal-related transcriptional regulator n=1 Tax=Streptomyces sp. MAR4 CNX-425 TaxID=3406343 RepID=UPI003B502BA0
MFEPFGVLASDEALYRLLLRHPPLDAAQLAAAAGRPVAGIAPAVDRLTELGLLTLLPGAPVRLVATRPDAAVDQLAARWQDRVAGARTAAAALLAELPVDRRHRPEDQVEILFGRGSVAARFDRLQRSVERELLVLDRPPYAQEPAEPNRAELEILARGVRVRGLYAPEALAVPGAYDVFEAVVAAGEEARVHTDVPLKLAVADASTAILPFSREAHEMVDSAFVIHEGALLEALVRLFELLWTTAVPVPVPRRAAGAGETSEAEADGAADATAAAESDAEAEAERQLLTLLAAGLKDEAVARRLGVSSRTLNRRVSALMRRLGARTRFQAGLQAARDGAWEA